MKKIPTCRPAIQFSVPAAEALSPFLQSAYGISIPKRIEYLARGFNDTFRVICRSNVYYLRIYRHGSSDLDSVSSELQLLKYLQEDRQCVGGVVPLESGGLSCRIQLGEGTRWAALFREAVGEPATKPSQEGCRLIGTSLAQLHQSMDRYSGPVLSRPRLDFRYLTERTLRSARTILKRHRPTDFSRLTDIVTSLKPFLAALPKQGPGYGLCHGDVHVRNVRISDTACNFFDFDFCGYGYRAYDLATFYWSRFQIEHDSEEDAEARHLAFLAGYDAVRPLSDEELSTILPFVLLREIWAIGAKIEYAAVWGAEGINDRFWDGRFAFLDDWLDHSKKL